MAIRLGIVSFCLFLLAPVSAPSANLTINIDSGAEKITFVGAFQRWDPDGNPTRQVDPKAKIDAPEVDVKANNAGEGKWVFTNLEPGKYDLVILGEDRLRLEGWEYAPVLEFDPFFPPTAKMEDPAARETIAGQIAGSRHYENKVVPLAMGGDDKAVRVLMMLIRDERTSYEGQMPGAATMRFEIWQYDYQYGGWTKQKRTRVMHRILLTRDELRKWTWLWDPTLGAIEIQSQDKTLDYKLPPRTAPSLPGLRPY